MTDSNYIVLSSAQNDLYNIYRYTFENWGIAQSDEYISEIEKSFARIARRDFGVRIRKYRLNSIEYLSYSINRHIIFFKYENNKTHIYRVLHQSMDFGRHLDK